MFANLRNYKAAGNELAGRNGALSLWTNKNSNIFNFSTWMMNIYWPYTKFCSKRTTVQEHHNRLCLHRLRCCGQVWLYFFSLFSLGKLFHKKYDKCPLKLFIHTLFTYIKHFFKVVYNKLQLKFSSTKNLKKLVIFVNYNHLTWGCVRSLAWPPWAPSRPTGKASPRPSPVLKVAQLVIIKSCMTSRATSPSIQRFARASQVQ